MDLVNIVLIIVDVWRILLDDTFHISVVNSTSTDNKTENTSTTTAGNKEKEHQSTKTKFDEKQKKKGGKRRRKNTINNKNKFENITKVQDNSTIYNKTAEERDEL